MVEGYKWINKASLSYLNDKSGYLLPGETVESKFELVAKTLDELLPLNPDYKKEFTYFLKNKFYALSTPFISNVGRETALPFSCSNQNIGDSLGEIYFAQAETAMMTKMGMGTSGKVNLRGKNAPITDSRTPSPGSLYFAESFNQVIKEVNQGVRRGYMALYWDVYHPDILDALEIQRDNNKIKDLNYGVCITQKFLDEAKAGNEKNREILLKIHESRFMTGLPYIFLTDNVNNAKPDVYIDNNLDIQSSNLCTEILEVSNDKYSFVCDIAAMNAEKIDDPLFGRAVEILTYALDALHTLFQRRLERWRDSDSKEENLKFTFLQKAYKSSVDFRDIGVGCTGYHTLLQNNNIAFESMDAKFLNARLFKTIQKHTLKASKDLANLYGEPEMLKGYGRRNCLMNAVAPNTSSAFILGQVSQGIEPIFSNYYIKDIAEAKHIVKNPNLEKVLESLGKNTREVWKSIGEKDGSVQHLDFLTEHQKAVFKTFQEISPMEVIIQASQRQKYIDQGQSINLMINQEVGYKEVNDLLYKAAELGIKTLYYQHGTNAAQQLRKSLLECESCAG